MKFVEKNTNTRSVIVGFVAGALMLGSIVAAASPATAATADGFVYELEGDEAAITGCENDTCSQELEVPATVGGYTVKKVESEAFRNKALTRISFDSASQLQTIGSFAFADNPLVDSAVAIPASVTTIDDNAFRENQQLPDVSFTGSNLTKIGSHAFYGTALTSVEIPSGLSTIDDYAFLSSELTQLTFAEGSQLQAIGTSAFAENHLSAVTFPLTLHSISGGAFEGNEIESLNFSANLTWIGARAFASNEIETVSFALDAVYDAYIRNAAFRDNKIKSLDIPSNVVDIQTWAFSMNPDLDDVKFRGNKPAFGAGIFEDTGSAPIYYRSSTTGWDGITELDGRAVVGVSAPVITSQPTGGLLIDGEHDLSVTVDTDIQGQGSVEYQWFKDGERIEGDTSSTYAATSVGGYQVEVMSWVGPTLSATATVSVPTPFPKPKPTPKPKPVVKKKQSAKVKLPSRMKRNKTYKLPKKTNAGVKLSWKVSGSGKCKINKKKATIKCRAATGKKHFRLTGTAKANSKFTSYKTTIKRRVR